MWEPDRELSQETVKAETSERRASLEVAQFRHCTSGGSGRPTRQRFAPSGRQVLGAPLK